MATATTSLVDRYRDSMVDPGTTSVRTAAVRTAGTTDPCALSSFASQPYTAVTTTDGQGAQHVTYALDQNAVDNMATAKRWYDDIVKNHVAVARSYRWLQCGGAFVNLWATTASSIPPADFAGSLGYDSPLGRCHDSTTFSRPTATCLQDGNQTGAARCPASTITASTPSILFDDFSTSVKDDSGNITSVTGWVVFNQRAYVAKLDDPMCTRSCVARFDRRCELEDSRLTNWPTRYLDSNGNYQLTRWIGGNTNAPHPDTFPAGW